MNRWVTLPIHMEKAGLEPLRPECAHSPYLALLAQGGRSNARVLFFMLLCVLFF